ncbi:MAG: S41 family peptidase [Anaerolineae bacterium]|nr:S41 family peptidase [Anaerolineae bacterium]
MTNKVLIAVGALVIVGVLTVGAFAGGLFIGRVTAPACPVETCVPSVSKTVEPTQPNGNDSTPTEDPAKAPSPRPTSSGQNVPPASDTFDYEIIQTVLSLLDEQFYGEIPDGKTLAYGAIRGMLMTLDDPYTSFIDPQITAILNEDASGQFEGIGATVRMREDGYLEVSSLISNSPAQAAGLQSGDIILAVGDQSLIGMGLYEAISYIRGPAGTDAKLEIARSGEEDSIFITVTRAKIEVPIVEYKMLDDDIGYILLTEFDANASARVEDALKELMKESPKSIIFDLRANPGGWLDQAIKVADIFLDKGLVAIERDSSGEEMRFFSYDGDIGEDIPMVVLVNGGSASASEIVAGALQDRERAVLIGTQTLGKGSVQRPNDLSDGSQLRVTIARWFTPNDKTIHGEGLTPDVEEEFPNDTPAGEDPQLDRAIEYLTQGQ